MPKQLTNLIIGRVPSRGRQDKIGQQFVDGLVATVFKLETPLYPACNHLKALSFARLTYIGRYV